LRRPLEIFRTGENSADSVFTFYRNDNSFDGDGLGLGTGVMETMKFATVTAGFGPEKNGLAPSGRSSVEVTGEKIDQIQKTQILEDADYIKIFDTLTLEEMPTRGALQGTLEPANGSFNKSSKKISSAHRETPDESISKTENWPEVSEYATAMPKKPSVRGPHQSQPIIPDARPIISADEPCRQIHNSPKNFETISYLLENRIGSKKDSLQKTESVFISLEKKYESLLRASKESFARARHSVDLRENLFIKETTDNYKIVEADYISFKKRLANEIANNKNILKNINGGVYTTSELVTVAKDLDTPNLITVNTIGFGASQWGSSVEHCQTFENIKQKIHQYEMKVCFGTIGVTEKVKRDDVKRKDLDHLGSNEVLGKTRILPEIITGVARELREATLQETVK
jgi:hypothetical protein